MALERKDRVRDTTTTTGTGTVSLSASAPTGFRSFVAAITSGATVRYLIKSADSTEWEVGEGIFTDATPDTLTRVTVYASSNSNNLVSFSAGTKDVSLVFTEEDTRTTAAPGADHSVSGMTIKMAATATTNFGDVCYIASTGKLTLIDADAIANMSGLFMCADAQIAADAIGNWLVLGIARDDTWAWTVGGLIYGTVTGTTGNTLSQTAPTGTDDVVQILGVATHADRMFFSPQLVQIELT